MKLEGDWEFDRPGKPEKPKLADPGLAHWLGDSERWRQYTDDRVYEVDSLVRQWLGEMSKNVKWRTTTRLRKYTMAMVFEQIYGRPYDHSRDAKMQIVLPRVLAYYSTKVQKAGSIGGKFTSKTVYTVSPGRLKKPPYSLRLRVEWLAERGEVPGPKNMCLPKDLKPGHARNPRTNANMERRSREAKDRYNERYKDRNR